MISLRQTISNRARQTDNPTDRQQSRRGTNRVQTTRREGNPRQEEDQETRQ